MRASGDGGRRLLVVPLGPAAQEVAAEAVPGLSGAVLAPALGYGADDERTVSLGTEALTALLVEYGRSAGRWASRLLVVSGHGGDVAALRTAVPRLRAEGREVAWFGCADPAGPIAAVPPQDPVDRLVGAVRGWDADAAGQLLD